MYQTHNSNLMAIASLLVFLAVLNVPAPIQSSPTYSLTSAVVDAQNPADSYEYSFTADEERIIRLTNVNDNIWQIRSSIGIHIEYSVDFPIVDIHTMISNYVVVDTGDPNRVVDFYFEKEEDARALSIFLKLERESDRIKYGVNAVEKLDCTNIACENGECGDPNCEGLTDNVSPPGQINVYLIPPPDTNGYFKKRFIIRGKFGDTQMVFTSKSFNMIWERSRRNANAMMSIQIRSFLIKLLIKFKNRGSARGFYSYVTSNGEVDLDIPLHIPDMWRDELLF